jgi:hypothetical protein
MYYVEGKSRRPGSLMGLMLKGGDPVKLLDGGVNAT